jgi:hypothetical protein
MEFVRYFASLLRVMVRYGGKRDPIATTKTDTSIQAPVSWTLRDLFRLARISQIRTQEPKL